MLFVYSVETGCKGREGGRGEVVCSIRCRNWELTGLHWDKGKEAGREIFITNQAREEGREGGRGGIWYLQLKKK